MSAVTQADRAAVTPLAVHLDDTSCRHSLTCSSPPPWPARYPRVAWMFRNRTWMIQETVLPVLSVAAFAYAYQAMDAPQEYIGFVVLGAAMTTFWLNVLWGMGAHLYWERDSGNLELYIMSPAPMMGILAGMALGGMTTTFVRATAILARRRAHLRRAVRTRRAGGCSSRVFVLTLAALYGLGMMFASLFLLWGREAWHIVNLLQEPVYLLTGTNFPVRRSSRRRSAGVGAADPADGRHGRDAAGAVPGPRRRVPVPVGGAEVAILAGWRWCSWSRRRRCLAVLEREGSGS